MIGSWTLGTLVDALGGSTAHPDQAFVRLSTDTRTIEPGDIFLALKGPNFDGHAFIQQALEKGAVAAVVSEAQDASVPVWLVDDTHQALGQIAAFNRSRFDAPVFAVTGSAGKTTVKEMLASILSVESCALATRGNLNNDIGAPLTLLSLEARHDYGVIELGASAIGEIAYTVGLTRPDVAILTNAMGAHLEGFGSLEGVVKAKGEIFDGLNDDGWAVINLDDPHAPQWLERAQSRNRITFGVDNPDADVCATALRVAENGCFSFQIRYRGEHFEIRLAVMGKHNVANAAAAVAAIIAAGLPVDLAVRGLEAFQAVQGRMCPLAGLSGSRLIDDSYNANPGSVKAAIDMLATLPGEHLLVLGDMAELGDTAAEQHADVGSYAALKGTGRLLAVGALSLHAVEAFNAAAGKQGGHYESREQLIHALRTLVGPGVTVLVKGSRSARMDKVVAELVEGNQ